MTPIQPSPNPDPNESTLIDRARRGDRSAMCKLIEANRGRVLRLATHVLRRPADGEDAAQEAFVKAFNGLHTWRGDSRFSTWLYQIVVRVCLDRQRAARWNREYSIEEAEPVDLANNGMQEIDNRLMVEALLDQLTLSMRAMLVLRELEGLEYEEIAKVLNIPVGRVRWRLHTARAKFREIYLKAMKELDDV